jgi:phosphoglycerate dehydrogenase-like enzyme
MRITAFVFTVVASFAPQSVSSYAFQGPTQLARRSALSKSSYAFQGSSTRLARCSSALSMSIEEATTKDNIKVGVIGMGRIGLVHLEAISKAPGVTAVIVSNPTVSKAEAGTNTNCQPEWKMLFA